MSNFDSFPDELGLPVSRGKIRSNIVEMFRAEAFDKKKSEIIALIGRKLKRVVVRAKPACEEEFLESFAAEVSEIFSIKISFQELKKALKIELCNGRGFDDFD